MSDEIAPDPVAPDESNEPESSSATLPDADSEPTTPAEPDNKKWYVVKVQSGREESIRDAIEKRVKIDGLEAHYGQIYIPTEKTTEVKNGRRTVKERKLFPGYLFCNVEFNDRILYLFRETAGVGDFVGGGLNKPPLPMSDREVEKLIRPKQKQEGTDVKPLEEEAPFNVGDHVKVKDGTFSGMEGVVKEIFKAKGAISVELTIFGRPVRVEQEYWQVEAN